MALDAPFVQRDRLSGNGKRNVKGMTKEFMRLDLG